jgi:hypothetical protein
VKSLQLLSFEPKKELDVAVILGRINFKTLMLAVNGILFTFYFVLESQMQLIYAC